MSDCTVAQVLTDAMSLLGDPDGEITQELWNDFSTAYGNLLSLSVKCQLPEIERETYYTLPAYTAALFPASLGVTDFAEPAHIFERGNVSTVAVSSTTDGTPITINTSAPHGRATNDRIELNGIQGVPGWVNRDWFITVTGASTFTLNGSIACGVNGSGGSLMYSQERFTELDLVKTIPSQQAPTQQVLGCYAWENGIIWFPGSIETRQLWIEYLCTEDPPQAGIIGFANGRELKFLSHATAAHFAPKRQLPMGPQLKADAYGQSGEPDGGGGLLRALIGPMLNQKQGRPHKPGKVRRRRNQFPGTL